MMERLFQGLFGTKNSREIKRIGRLVDRINELGRAYAEFSLGDFKEHTQKLQQRYKQGESLDDLLPEAFALVREAADRSNNTRHYDVQLVGGVVLHEGRIAEMRTGEGKTLVATLAAYLNAIPGDGVHVVTVNDYLAKRDAEWMGPIYETLGFSVGVIQSNQESDEKRLAYKADITYGTNNEFGFDYLRDNMAFRQEDRFQRGLKFAVVDEVDSILIDEARTPLIISGPADESTDLYKKINRLAPKLKQQEMVENDLPSKFGGEEVEETGDFFVDEKNRQVELTERGHLYVEEELMREGILEEGESLYSPGNLGLLHHIHSALRAHFLFKRDVDYMVNNGQIVIVDEHTGRAMPGRRWSEGLHQAVEAKEKVTIQRESQTLASTTFQNYFRLYEKLSGMTGTADTEAFEFRQIYGLDVVVIPTNAPMIRDDRNDLVFLSIDEKYDAIVGEIEDCIRLKRPVLVGTASIESSERLSTELDKRKIKHNVLNAKQHEREADVIAQAGRPGTVTIATNMAGRGTDIVLGGNWQVELGEELDNEAIKRAESDWKVRHDDVISAGGLHIIGTERHESRRIDNQLRGRSGRQGDPGSSRFFLSMEDNLLRIFVSDRVRSVMESMNDEKGEPVEARMINNSIERAQRKVEGRNFDIRKNLLDYDDVANDQRQVIYEQRNELMESSDISDMVSDIRSEVVDELVSEYIPPQSIDDQWDIGGLARTLKTEFDIEQDIEGWLTDEPDITEEEIRERISSTIETTYQKKIGDWRTQNLDIFRIEKEIMLSILDQKWKEHLSRMDHLRQGIHLRAYAQKQPKQEYKRESFELFQEMLDSIKRDVIRILSRVQLEEDSRLGELEQKKREALARQMQFSRREAATGAQDSDGNIGRPGMGDSATTTSNLKPETFVRDERKIGRNEKCPCGSGKKYKHCCGQAA